MAPNGQRQTLEQNETNEGLSVPDTWEQLPRDEDPVTVREGLRLNADALRKALDGLRLTPTPGESPTASPATPAVQNSQQPMARCVYTCRPRRLSCGEGGPVCDSESRISSSIS